jgi:hypothetical protein
MSYQENAWQSIENIAQSAMRKIVCLIANQRLLADVPPVRFFSKFPVSK